MRRIAMFFMKFFISLSPSLCFFSASFTSMQGRHAVATTIDKRNSMRICVSNEKQSTCSSRSVNKYIICFVHSSATECTSSAVNRYWSLANVRQVHASAETVRLFQLSIVCVQIPFRNCAINHYRIYFGFGFGFDCHWLTLCISIVSDAQ